MTKSDILIVGAGPAGAWAAYCLAKAGARVTLFDASHPREKPCGGGITGRALAIVAEALSDRPRLPFVTIRTARFEAEGTPTAADVTLSHPSPYPALIICSRRDFDGALLAAAEQAGAQLIPQRIRDVQVDGRTSLVQVRTDRAAFDGTFLIGADGANSLVRRRLSRPFPRAALSIATGCYAADVSDDRIVIRCTQEPPGYLWSFPRLDHLAIGVCAGADRSDSRSLGAYVRRWIQSAAVAPETTLAAYSWPIPTLTGAHLSRERPAGERWLLVGDAAGLVDPITREGIFFALRSGELAAQSILQGSDVAENYLMLLRVDIYPELQQAATLKGGFFEAAFSELLLEALCRSAPIRSVMADVVAGRQSYRGLRRRLVATREFGLAGRLLLTQAKRWVDQSVQRSVFYVQRSVAEFTRSQHSEP